MAPTARILTQRDVCMTCTRPISRRWLGVEYEPWHHDRQVRPTNHAGIPTEYHADYYPDIDPCSNDIGDWSQHGRIGSYSDPASTDRHCPDCGAEVYVAGRQCIRCTDQTITEVDQ